MIKLSFSTLCWGMCLCRYVCVLFCVAGEDMLLNYELNHELNHVFGDVFRLKTQFCGEFWLLCFGVPGADFCFSFPLLMPHPFLLCASHHVVGDWWAEVSRPTDCWASTLLQQHLLPLYVLFLSTSDLALLLICHLASSPTFHSITIGIRPGANQKWHLPRLADQLPGGHGPETGEMMCS